MSQLCLVTGANGHLGNTLVRALLDQGYRVRAGVRDVNDSAAFEGLDCERVYAELFDEAAMLEALNGVDLLFQVAAVFKHWARHPYAEIIEPNVEGTRRVLQAAAKAGVKRVVYVSSVAAIGQNGLLLDPGFHFNFVDVRDVALGMILVLCSDERHHLGELETGDLCPADQAHEREVM